MMMRGGGRDNEGEGVGAKEERGDSGDVLDDEA